MSMEKINSEELHGKQERIPLSDDELEQVSGGTGNNPCLVVGPYWGNSMRTGPALNALCYQPDVYYEYVNTQGNNCKFRLWQYGQPVGWTDRAFLQ